MLGIRTSLPPSALTTVVYPAGAEAVIYVIMMVVLLIRPRGLLGEEGMLT